MIDSTNPRQLADNIRKLWDKFKSISGDLLPSRSTATTGQILKLTGETKTPAWADEYSYTPPAYSTTETATGQKWIDGKDIYCCVFVGNLPVITEAITFNIEVMSFDNIINLSLLLKRTDDATFSYTNYAVIKSTTNNLRLYSVGTSFSEASYICIIFYTKPDPTPGRAPEDSEQEPESEKKTTKKKTK